MCKLDRDQEDAGTKDRPVVSTEITPVVSDCSGQSRHFKRSCVCGSIPDEHLSVAVLFVLELHLGRVKGGN